MMIASSQKVGANWRYDFLFLLLCPVHGACNCFFPRGIEGLPCGDWKVRMPSVVYPPIGFEVFEVRVKTYGKPCSVGGTERRGFLAAQRE